MSDNLKLGQIITTPQNRDAIHIAVAPVVAANYLRAGDHVSIKDGQAVIASVRGNHVTDGTGIGIVDPFLLGTVMPGETFWLFLYPGSITALRHEWTHPAFPADSSVEAVAVDMDKAASEARLRAIASDLGVGYEEVIWAGQHKDYPGCFGNEIEGDREIKPEFWDDIKRVTGKVAPEGKRPEFFRCAC